MRHDKVYNMYGAGNMCVCLPEGHEAKGEEFNHAWGTIFNSRGHHGVRSEAFVVARPAAAPYSPDPADSSRRSRLLARQASDAVPPDELLIVQRATYPCGISHDVIGVAASGAGVDPNGAGFALISAANSSSRVR